MQPHGTHLPTSTRFVSFSHTPRSLQRLEHRVVVLIGEALEPYFQTCVKMSASELVGEQDSLKTLGKVHVGWKVSGGVGA